MMWGCARTHLALDSQSAPAAGWATGVVYHDRNGNAVRDAREPGVPHVCVSNGREVVQTDASGRYRLPVDDDTILFVIKPRGWRPVVDDNHISRGYYIHKPHGSPAFEYPGVPPTGPLPASVDFALYPQDEPQRFRAIIMGDSQVTNAKEVAYLAHDIIEELAGVEAAFGMTLGDLVNNNLAMYDDLIATVAQAGKTWYHVSGNHDENYDAPADRQALETYQRHFGPPYYAFDYGPVHFLVLDDVVWEQKSPQREKAGYYAGLGEKQMEFVRNDLSGVPRDRLVVLTMHIPLRELREAEREQLFALLADRLHTLSLSGHYHHALHDFLAAEQGWHSREPHHHMVVVTSCGCWWGGVPDEVGIPHATMRDGVPNGYLIATFDGHKYSFEFKAARRPADYQMQIFAPERVARADAAGTEVVVNVFAGGPRSVVHMRVGDGGEWLTLQPARRPDPYYVRLKEAEKSAEYLQAHRLPKEVECLHLWAGHLPAGLPTGTTTIHVRTTDMFGQTYEARRVITIE